MNSLNSQYRSLDHTLRRYYIDEFFNRHVFSIRKDSLVLDLGGNKIQKRGLFDIEQFNFRVTYVNISAEKKPDVLADAANLPFGNNIFDVVICSELLEHLYDPERVLREVMRVLKPNGIFLITVPFLVPYHADPFDFGRYTDQYWKKVLNDVGFYHVNVERQGYFWSVLLDMLREYVIQMRIEQIKFWCGFMRYFMEKVIIFARSKAIMNEAFPKLPARGFFQKYTTGFGITAIKDK